MNQDKFNFLRQDFKARQDRILPSLSSGDNLVYLVQSVFPHLLGNLRTTVLGYDNNNKPYRLNMLEHIEGMDKDRNTVKFVELLGG